MADAVNSLATIALTREGRPDLLRLLNDPSSVKVVDQVGLDELTLTVDGIPCWSGPAEAVAQAAAILREQRDALN